jgi:AcrR family transcriptional regulator
MATTFQRARSDEQRAIRRQTILDTAAGMLEEMPVAELSLNELSRRVGLAKSNVLRYFDSREAVLLELLNSLTCEWLEQLSGELDSAVSARAGFERRAGQLGAVLARSLSERPVLCDLIGAQAAVLEHNVSFDAIASFKRRGAVHAATLGGLVRRALPELSEDEAWRLVVGVLLLATSLWAYANPSQALLDAYERIPELTSMHLEFSAALEDALVTMAMGLRARSQSRVDLKPR